MTLVLNNGNFFEDHVKGNSTKMPSSTATFDEYEIKIDISSFTGEVESDESIKSFQTLSLNQLKDTLPAIKIDYDQYLEGRALNLYRNSDAKNLYAYPDSLINTKLKPVVLDNFDEQAQLRILIASVAKSDQALSIIKSKKTFIKFKRNILNKYETEFYNRIAFSLSCLILFFIGAPLGSIIRKGGFGLPMILAICIYVVYFFTNTFGRNLAEESSVSALLGSWISAIIMIPFAFLLTRRATKDRGIFNIDVFLQPITRIFKNIKAKGKANAQNNDE
jgi:lipopolysaccharide export system permease protein